MLVGLRNALLFRTAASLLSVSLLLLRGLVSVHSEEVHRNIIDYKGRVQPDLGIR